MDSPSPQKVYAYVQDMVSRLGKAKDRDLPHFDVVTLAKMAFAQ